MSICCKRSVFRSSTSRNRVVESAKRNDNSNKEFKDSNGLAGEGLGSCRTPQESFASMLSIPPNFLLFKLINCLPPKRYASSGLSQFSGDFSLHSIDTKRPSSGAQSQYGVSGLSCIYTIRSAALTESHRSVADHPKRMGLMK
jgi:hypothetical protein